MVIRERENGRIRTPEELKALVDPPLEAALRPKQSDSERQKQAIPSPPDIPQLESGGRIEFKPGELPEGAEEAGFKEDPENPNQLIQETIGGQQEIISKETFRRNLLSQAQRQREGETGLTMSQEAALQELQARQGQRLEQLQRVLAVAEDIPSKMDRLAAAGLIPIKIGRRIVNDMMSSVGLGLSEQELEKTEQEALENPFTKRFLAGVGTVTDIEILGVELKDFYEDRTAIDSLVSDAKQLRETAEATLRGARDSRNYAQAIAQLTYIQELTYHKYKNAMELAGEDPSSRKESLDLTDDLFRDMNRLEVDRQILERLMVTGDPVMLDRRLSYGNVVEDQDIEKES